MPATESLTIEIQGDSSGLSQALDDALAKVESLQSAADGAATAAAGIGGKFATISSALQPLQQIGQQLTRITQQAQALGQQPISLNVQPALSALQMLMSAIQAVAAQLSALSMPGGGPTRGPAGTGGGGGSAGGSGGSSPRNSSPQSSPARTSAPQYSHVPPPLSDSPMGAPRWGSPSETAMSASHRSPISRSNVRESTRSESPLRQPISRQYQAPAQRVIAASAHLPIRDFSVASQTSTRESSTPDSRRVTSAQSSFSSSVTSLDRSAQWDHSSSTVNHFGGITIEVRETADVNHLIRDLRLQGLTTRHRQG